MGFFISDTTVPCSKPPLCVRICTSFVTLFTSPCSLPAEKDRVEKLLKAQWEARLKNNKLTATSSTPVASAASSSLTTTTTTLSSTSNPSSLERVTPTPTQASDVSLDSKNAATKLEKRDLKEATSLTSTTISAHQAAKDREAHHAHKEALQSKPKTKPLLREPRLALSRDLRERLDGACSGANRKVFREEDFTARLSQDLQTEEFFA